MQLFGESGISMDISRKAEEDERGTVKVFRIDCPE